ncbi:MAG: prolyl oligopeptidase family serine peptidase [Chloroflexota bacterium]|nr:MAG: hypothetical protein DIU68_17330 [Chloroflexota bacterium]
MPQNDDALLDALLSLPEMEFVLPSPNGQWVAWMWIGLGETADVYAVRTDGTAEPVRLTMTDQNTWPVSWSSDSQSLVVAQDTDGNERVQLFRVRLDAPQHMEPLTEANPGYYIHGGQLHPNGRWLIYSANVDENGQEIEPSLIYRHDLETGERVILARPNSPTYMPPSLNPQGTHVLYQRKDLHPSGEQLWLVSIDGEGDREIVNIGAERKVYGVWFPDGEHILIHAEADTHYRVGVYSLADSSLRWLIEDPARNIERVSFPQNADRAVLLDVRSTRPYGSLLDIKTGAEEAFPVTPSTLVPVAPAPGGAWTALHYSSTQPMELVRFVPENGEMTSLTRIWDMTTLKPADLIPAENFHWRSVDGMEIQGWLYRARGEAKGTIVHVHGGPTWHYEDWIDAEVQYYASQGFNVFQPNYRGSTGFGRAFTEAIKEDGWGGREQDDIRTGIEALIDANIAQPGRIGITGTSYGGYSSWCAITRLPIELVAAAAPICGMTDLVVDYETTRPDLRPYSAEMMGGTPDEVPKRFRERSPIHFVDNIRGRLLIVQGDQDPNVTPQHVTDVCAALDRVGIAYDVLSFADEGHGIHRRANKKTLYKRLVQFFEEALAG